VRAWDGLRVQKHVRLFPNEEIKKMTGSSQVAPNVIRVFNVNKCPNSESQTKGRPQFGFGIDKDRLC